MSVRLSAHMEHLGSHWTDFHEMWHLSTSWKICQNNSDVIRNLPGITGTLHEDRYKFLIVSRPFLLRMRNVSDKSCRENQNTHFVFNNFFLIQNRAVYNIMWRNIVEPGRPHMTIWRMRITCCVPKTTNTHAEYVTLFAFPLQQWLHERGSVSRYTCSACIVIHGHLKAEAVNGRSLIPGSIPCLCLRFVVDEVALWQCFLCH